ncbi:M28 family peptidase [Mariniblastus fucicola]|uniref:Peptidase family M28 n=1 Tax=Mariniblastus fucicola TaxID=980251 RepID=A0A5B9P552_9BACT|nr:M28 family peptidase [Mariniblastus fucicola]QEG21528.1 Peptidase family M28 [Mariniblastus fucicola]
MSAKIQILFCVLLLSLPAVLFAQQPTANAARQTKNEPATNPAKQDVPPESRIADAGADFNKDFAFNHLKAICDIGPRKSTSEGMATQQAMLQKHFEALGAMVGYQNFEVNDPRTGQPATLSNLIVRWHPERTKRLMICCHYDTRPFPDSDPVNPQGVFIGANDGASGAAFLCELGRHMQNQDGPVGFDFVFFDGEEFVFVARRDPMFLGSLHFARQYAAGNWDVKYDYAVLVDMIGDKSLQLKMEVNSYNMARNLTKMIWSIAKDLKVREFRASKGHTIKDDHLPLNEIAKIPTCDIIDFDYPKPGMRNRYWHTTQDSVENCSAESLGKVGIVMLEWTRRMQTLYEKNEKKKSRTANRR